MQQETLHWESTHIRSTAGVLLWSSQQQECRLVSQGQWVKNLSVCFSFFFTPPPKTVQGLGMVLKQQGSLKLAQCESPDQRFLHGSTRALPSLPPLHIHVGVFWRPRTCKPNPNSQVMEMEAWLSLTRMATCQLTRFPLHSCAPSLFVQPNEQCSKHDAAV